MVPNYLELAGRRIAALRMPIAGRVGLAALIVLAAFAADVLTPLGFAVRLLYFVSLLVLAVAVERRTMFIFAAVCSVLIVAGYFLSPPGIPRGFALANRGLGIVVLWFAAYLLSQRYRAAELEATIAAIPDGVVIYRSDGSIANSNAAAQQLFGYAPEEWTLPFAERMRRHNSTLVSTRSTDPADLPAMRALRGETVTGEMVAMRSGEDAEPRYLSASAAPIRADGGEVVGAVASFVDLTARHLLEAELRQARDQLRQEAETLEQRVQERTAELEAANAALAETSARLRASWEQTQAFSRQMVDALENERKAIASELHDRSGQSLTSLLIGMGLLQRHADCSADMKDRLEVLKQQTEAIMQDLHRLSRDLRPASLDRLGLAPAVRQYVDAFARQHELEVQFEAVGAHEDGNTAPEVKTTLYRVVQEALTNVARHARAQHVGVLLQRTEEYALALIEDDGVGFDIEEAAAKGRLGLLGMRERVEMLGGQLELESAAGAGTTIIAKVPLSTPSAAPEGDAVR